VAGRRLSAGASVGDGFPDQLGDIDDQIRFLMICATGCADLANADTDHVVEPTVRFAVG